MRIITKCTILLGACIVFCACSLAAAETDALSPSKDRAVKLAREGEFDQALQMLAVLREAAPNDAQLLYDETVVLFWAGHDKLVLENAAIIDPEIAPDYVLAPVAKAWRNAGDFEMAGQWYSTLLSRDAANLDARLGLAMTRADMGNFGEAWRTLGDAPADQKDTVPITLTEAYVYRRQGHFMDALLLYQRVLDAEPQNHDAMRGRVLALRMALLPNEALTLARTQPHLLSDEELIQLEADVAALQIRHGAQSTYPVDRRFEGTDRALSRIDTLLTRPGLDPEIALRLRYDRVVALSDRLLMAEAIAEFESLQVDYAEAPTHVLTALGWACLFERQPERARQILELARTREPGNLEIQFRLFFAFADLQEHDRALELAESLMAQIPVTNQLPGSPVVKGSETYLRAAIMAGLARAYSDQLADSQQHFEHILADLPHNTDIRQELANVYRWRGWLDLALAQYAQVLAVEPELVSARIGNAHANFDNRDYAAVEPEVNALGLQYGVEPAVRNLEERWQVHNRNELNIEASLGQSSGPTFGEDQYQVDATWHSKPIAHRYRIFLASQDAFAEFPEGNGRRRRIDGGMEYRYRRWLATAGLSADRDGGGVGFRGSLDHRFSDHLSVGGLLETRSKATPLRGERIGVSSNLIGIHAQYARHESTAFRGALSFQDLSDGNQASSVLLGGEQRLINHASYKMTLLGEAFFENRDRDDVAYFSPRHSFTSTAGIRNDWSMYRRYDFALSHGLTGRVGQTRQAGFASRSIWAVDYEFRGEIKQGWEAHVGISRRSNVYDGTREYANFMFAGFTGRF